MEARPPGVLAGKNEVGRRAKDEGRPPEVLAGKVAEARPPEVLADENEVGRRAEDEGRPPEVLAGEVHAEKCDAHKASTTANQSSGTSKHVININPEMGTSLTKLHG